MSLDWDITKCKNVEQLKGDKWPATNCIIWGCLTVDLAGITEDNIDEWEYRLEMANIMMGGALGVKDVEGKSEEWNPSRQDLIDRIGLRTNVSTRTRKQFEKKMMLMVNDRVINRLRQRRRDNGLMANPPAAKA